MLSTQDRVTLWRDNTPPRLNKPLSYDAFVVLELDNISIGGEVRWDVALEQYVFQPGEETSDTSYELYEITYLHTTT